MTPENVAEIRRRIQEGESKTDLAKAFGVSRETLYKYLDNKHKGTKNNNHE